MSVPNDQKTKVFLSYIAEEAKLGIAMKDGLEDAFCRRIAVFVSSDPRDNPGGDSWLERIKRELQDPLACMLVLLVSPTSVREPWISIELGAAWILNRPVFPLCHSGQELGALPRPMQDFGGADLASDDAASRLLNAIEQATGLHPPSRWPVAQFLEDMRKAANAIGVKTGPVVPAPVPGPELPQDQVRILQALAVVRNAGEEDVFDTVAARHSGVAPAAFTYHANELVKLKFAFVSHYGEGAHYRIAPAGSGWLLAHGAMPEM
jgi:hypothetical protein